MELKPMLVGYARTSTIDQAAGFNDQVEQLRRLGAEKIFQEQVSAVVGRPQLEAALDFVRGGDVLIVTRSTDSPDHRALRSDLRPIGAEGGDDPGHGSRDRH